MRAWLAALAALGLATGAQAQRIVSLSPFLTEAVYAVGAGDKLIAVSEFSDYPPEAKKLPTISNAVGISWEKLAVLKPDIALIWADSLKEGDRERFARVGARVEVFAGRRLDDVPRTLREVARLTGQAGDPESARAFEQRIAALRRANAGKPRISAFLEIQHRPLMTIAGDHYMNDALAICGAENPFASLPGVAPEVSWEAMLARDPAVIVGAGSPEGEKAFRERWKERPTLRAVRNDAFVYVNGDHFYRPTPRLADGVEALCRGIDALRR
ncbi:cobalamin-binding protein [Usitatibacter palustris]|uniref:Vitamin B12-binding protein n=1 Tax=Usitatibacter palustris TaxID=2732487 RepID=A0A6M4HB70_9PROT|nr:cobalamin-binding protein [Usitatibacter palustris]QJR15714.1 Vitamin B12-binding protein [Usitatibacter palustris]